MSDDQTPAADAAKATKKEKMVRVKVLRDVMAGGEIRLPGTVLEVSETEAKELCDVTFRGYHPFYGMMPEIGALMGDVPNPLQRKQIARAVRVA